MSSVARGLVRVVLAIGLFAVVVFAVEQFVPGARAHLSEADGGWLAVAVGLELLACGSYAVLFHLVFARAPQVLSARRSGQVALGELGAFAVVPTGIGGPMLRFWALRASGMPWRTVIVRSVSHAGIFNIPYVVGAIVLGLGVALRLLPGHAPTLTALAPAALVILVCAAVLGATRLSRGHVPAGQVSVEQSSWGERARSALHTLPDGVRDMMACVRAPWPLLAAIGWWVGDCAALGAAFHAVGGAPPVSVLALAYMLGQLGNAVPLPGGIGGVEPVMLGIFAASGVDVGIAGAAIVCYRAIALGLQGAIGALAVATLAPELREQRRVA